MASTERGSEQQGLAMHGFLYHNPTIIAMILGKISGRITTKSISFEADARVRKLDYVSIKDPEGRWILGNIDSVTRYESKTMASARIIGYRDSRGFLKTPKVPFAPNTPVFSAPKEFIRETVGLNKDGAYMGLLEGYDIKVYIDIQKMIRKHIAILAKTGAGKSYAGGVLLEELAEAKMPVVVIDPHGEYNTLRLSNKNKNETRYFERFGISAKNYRDMISVFGVQSGRPLRLNSKLKANEIFSMLPASLSSTQKGLLFSALRNLEGRDYVLRDVIEEVANSNSQAKWNLVSMLEFLEGTGVFSANPTLPKDIVQPGKIAVIDLKEDRPEIQQIVALKLIEDLFRARKYGKIPSFLLMIEEAHNFCPERGFGEVASSKIIRTVASEGRKFGFGLCIVTQRPARVDKSVLSQCNTQVILKVTNPNDLKAITDSVEGVTPGLREEIKDLPVGVAMIVGATDQPLVIDVRVRRTQHGGEDIMIGEAKEFKETPLAFSPQITEEEIRKEYKSIREVSLLHYPMWMVKALFGADPVTLYVDGITGEVIFQREDAVERSRGIRSLMELAPSSRMIIFYLTKNRLATPEKISEDLKMPLSTVQSNVRELLAREYLATDGYMFRNRLRLENIPPNPSNVQLSGKPEKAGMDGRRLEFMVTQDFVRKISELWSMPIRSIEPAYYPYWLVTHKDKKILIDALNRSPDPDTTSLITKFL
jgi:DNA helicase HerA-like ATPase